MNQERWNKCSANHGNPTELCEYYITRYDGEVVESIYDPSNNSYDNCGKYWPKARMPRIKPKPFSVD